ncbi:MAG TPA: mechanosensitive ion channel domain-containing protein [Ignavibacteriaceae bacterium]|nr:mechanosensitive ion channel domain-containing protein [Ignavibacteriaceae bacterium]
MNKIRILTIILQYIVLPAFLFTTELTCKTADSSDATTESFIDSLAEEIIQNKKENQSVKAGEVELSWGSIKKLINIEKIIWVFIVFFAGYYLLKFILKILRILARKSTRYRLTLNGILPLVRLLGWLIIIYIIVIIIIQPSFVIILILSAAFGIVIGLAAQDIVKNVFGGIMIIFDKPFRVGDKIQIGEYYGEVFNIGLRSTRIITDDDSTVSIPNSEFMINSVSNVNSGETNCQVVAEIFLPVDANTTRVRELALEAAKVSKYVYLNKPVSVLFSNVLKEKKSYLKMTLKAYVMDIKYEFVFKSDLTEIVIRELLKEGIITKDF